MLDAVPGGMPTPKQQGNDSLGNIFGSKDVGCGVASEVAALTGIDEGIIKKMLPLLAMAAAGYMAKKADSSASEAVGGWALAGILGSIVIGMMTR